MGIRPKSVTVLAIIGIVLAALGILSLLWSGASFMIQRSRPNPMLGELFNDPTYLTSMCVLLPVGLGERVLLLWASIDSLRLRHWARRGMLAYGWLAIIVGLSAGVFNIVYSFPRMLQAME